MYNNEIHSDIYVLYHGKILCRQLYRQHIIVPPWQPYPKRCLVEGLLLAGGDGAVGGWVGDAGKNESVGHLVVIQERLVGLVNGSGLDLSGARRASSSTARVWKVNSYTDRYMSVIYVSLILLLQVISSSSFLFGRIIAHHSGQVV